MPIAGIYLLLDLISQTSQRNNIYTVVSAIDMHFELFDDFTPNFSENPFLHCSFDGCFIGWRKETTTKLSVLCVFFVSSHNFIYRKEINKT